MSKTISITFNNPIPTSYRAARVAATLDDGKRCELRRVITCDAPPELDEPWRVGMIIGPSGAGKTSVARRLYGAAIDWRPTWRGDRPIVDEFEEADFETLQAALAAVGFASPVRQLQSYNTLSVGEQFRCDLARRLLEDPNTILVVDEFANALDPTVAAAAALATRKALDQGLFKARRLVAVTSRDETRRFLEPDWTLDMTDGKLTRGRLRRPRLQFDVRRAQYSSWREFSDFHYLSGSLNRAARRFVATWRPNALDDATSNQLATPSKSTTSEQPPPTCENRNQPPEMVAFAAILPCEGRVGRRRVHRLVVKPQYQGLGVGGAFLDALAKLEFAQGRRLEIVTGSRFFANRLQRSKLWRLRKIYPHGRKQRSHGKPIQGSFGRGIASFEYLGGDDEQPQVLENR